MSRSNLLLEELGTYLESNTEVKNFTLTRDKITIITAGIVRTIILDEKWDKKTYYLKAKITADPEDVTRKIDAIQGPGRKAKNYGPLESSMTRPILRSEAANSAKPKRC